ncbi:sugar transferase [Asticcacaulis tiandongensis]|uniref:sugar transferase n=1 Tax=Asticcacaulis tiandongensis TaxID=2565365 RepID=UPI00112D8AC9|nr:sugar transferase [Asticcacaulis tiandongensis]
MVNTVVETLSRKGTPFWAETLRLDDARERVRPPHNTDDQASPDPHPFFSGGFIRLIDVIVSLVALVFLLPAMVLVGLWVRLNDGGPAFYAQPRIGRGGKLFKCYKFRSMRVNADALLTEYLLSNEVARLEWEKEHKLKNDPRITGLGHFIRKTSLDELPQLWNVLRGDMSLVGPRPIVAAEVVKYGHSFPAYASVTPGITGLWQVMGRNDVCYHRRVAMDRLFARRRNLRLYVFILLATIPAVLLQKGSY